MTARLAELTRQLYDKARANKPDAVGYAGVPDGLGYPGLVVDGYVYDIPSKPGYQYFRGTLGVEQEVGEAIIGGVRRNPQRKIELYREGPALVSRAPNALGAVAGDGADADENWVPDHTHDASVLTYTPDAPGDWDEEPETVQAALDALAERVTADQWMIDRVVVIPSGASGIVLNGVRLTSTGSLTIQGSLYIV